VSAAALTRDATTGRFTPRADYPRCEACGWLLAESLAGRYFCPLERCQHYRTDAGPVPGVDAGLLAVVPGE
jgi:hypothetical protein